MPKLYDALLRHQMFLEGLKQNQSGLAQDTVVDIFAFYVDALRQLDVATLDKLTMRKLQQVIGTLRDLSVTLYSKYTLTFIKFLRSFSGVQSSATARILSSVGNIVRKTPLSTFNREFNDKTFSEAERQFMPYNGERFTKTLDGIGSKLITEIEGIIRQGFINKETSKQVIDRLLGVKQRMPSGEMKVRGGIFNKYVSDLTSTAETVVQYVAEHINHKVQSFYYDRYIWVSVIDAGTTAICTERDGKRYEYGKGPIPPAHRRCRSKTIPDDELPKERPGLFTWFKSQPKTLQDTFLSADDAKSLRDGTMKADDVRGYKSPLSLTLKDYGNATDKVLED